MALSSEDKKDVSHCYGKALANKVSKATKDNKRSGKFSAKRSGVPSFKDEYNEYVKKNPVKLGPNGRPMPRT